jgi:hypothetical protein
MWLMRWVENSPSFPRDVEVEKCDDDYPEQFLHLHYALSPSAYDN